MQPRPCFANCGSFFVCSERAGQARRQARRQARVLRWRPAPPASPRQCEAEGAFAVFTKRSAPETMLWRLDLCPGQEEGRGASTRGALSEEQRAGTRVMNRLGPLSPRHRFLLWRGAERHTTAAQHKEVSIIVQARCPGRRSSPSAPAVSSFPGRCYWLRDGGAPRRSDAATPR